MARFLKKCTIATTGYFGEDKDEKKIQNWIEKAGGTYARHIDKDVTHLVTSIEHFKQRVPRVTDALTLGGIKIVSFDWLEDSLYIKNAKGTAQYLMKRIAKERASLKVKKKEIRQQREIKRVHEWKNGVKEFERLMGAKSYHVYRDDTGFEYVITIARLDERTNSPEQFTIRLWETNAQPHLYCANAVHTIPTATRTVTQVLAPLGSPFDLTLSRMTGFFLEKTMVPWDERLEANDIADRNPLAFAYLKPATGPYGRLSGQEEEDLAHKLNEELAAIKKQEADTIESEPEHHQTPELNDVVDPADNTQQA